MNARESLSHDQAAELLPWLVNDSLDEREKRAVLAHAHACVICRRELSDLRQLQDSVSRASSATPIPEPDMRNIHGRIDAYIARQHLGRDILARLRSVFDSPWRIAFAAQSLILVALATVLLWPGPRGGEFTTLTQPEHIADGQYVRAVFNPDLQQAEIAILLDKFGLSIVDGPSSRGVYTLGVSNSENDRDMLVSRLQNEPTVLFAQPVTIGVGR